MAVDYGVIPTARAAQMIGQLAIRRRVGIWLAGLLFIAQIVAVAPLMSEHTAHVAESELGLLSKSVITHTLLRGHHHHYRGDADGFVQHHELQDLGGAFSLMATC